MSLHNIHIVFFFLKGRYENVMGKREEQESVKMAAIKELPYVEMAAIKELPYVEMAAIKECLYEDIITIKKQMKTLVNEALEAQDAANIITSSTS